MTKAAFAGGILNGVVFKDVVYAMDYLEVVGFMDDLSKERVLGGCVHRKELDNQPIFKGYLAPAWNDNGLLYESQEVYETRSI